MQNIEKPETKNVFEKKEIKNKLVEHASDMCPPGAIYTNSTVPCTCPDKTKWGEIKGSYKLGSFGDR